MKSLSTAWSKHIKDPGSKETFEKTILASTTMGARLLELLNEAERELDSAAVSKDSFDSPSWAFQQAYYLGEKSRIKKLRDLLEPFNRNK